MNSLPTSISILGKTWTIESPALSSENSDDYGETSPDEATIRVFTEPHEAGPGRGTIWDSFFHECIHAALHTSGVSAIIGDSKLEEGIARALEHGLSQHFVFKAVE